MERIKDFERFYNVKIEPVLPVLTRQNKTADIWGIIMVLSILSAMLSLVLNIGLEEYRYGTVFTLFLFMFSIYSVYNYAKKEDAYTGQFKGSIIKVIIDYLHPGLVYKPYKSIPAGEYVKSGLYRRRYNYFDGDDYLGGIYKNVHFHCSELSTGYTRYGRRNSGHTYTIFKGLFLTASVNAKYKAGTYVWIKGEEQLGASIADEHYRLFNFPHTAHVSMGYELFDNNYSVYSTNPEEARKILDKDMMNNLLHFRKQINRKVVFSVVMGRCYVAVPVKEDLFEPANPLGDKEEIKKYFFGVLLILSIINQLQLNRLK